jgi:nitroreductase
LCYYYEQHQEANQKINDYFPEEDYFWLKERLNQSCSSTIQTNKKDYFHFSESDYFNFSNSRHSVRSYSGEIIPKEKLEAVITLANNAPSVCNRQSASVYVIENKQQIDKLVEIQGGLKGFSENLNQLIILTTNRNYFSSIGERYQFYIDGGIYLMNLLYALHYYQIVACPAHWAMTVEDDECLRQIVGIPESHKVICFVGIGMPNQNFPITLSLKRSATDNLHFI